jgi:atypical dual specificity phosphatase
VDGYELSIRLEHLLRRLAALAGAATAEAPACVAPRLFLGGAVAADSVHLLAHRGITHIINATEVRGAVGGSVALADLLAW